MSAKHELHYKDIATTSYACDTTGSVTLLNGISTGATATTRQGRKTWFQQLHVQGRLTPASDAFKRSRVDVYIVFDKQPGAALPSITDMLTESFSGAPKNLDYRERFKFIRKTYFVLGGDAQAANAKDPTINLVEIHENLTGLFTVYKGDGNAIGDISTGAIYLVTIGDQASPNGASLSVNVRLRWSEN